MSASDFAPILGRIPSGLFVVTCTRGGAETALLASWVQQCSFDPPMVTIALRKGREVIDWIVGGAPCAINILADGQKELLGHFGKGMPLSQLPREPQRVERMPGRAPVLRESLGVLHIASSSVCDAGDHALILARVIDGALHFDERPIVHVRKSGLNY